MPIDLAIPLSDSAVGPPSAIWAYPCSRISASTSIRRRSRRDGAVAGGRPRIKSSEPSEERCLGVGTTGTGITAFEGTPFIHGQSAPHAVVLVGMHGPSQAGVSDLTAAADNFCFVDLVKRAVGVPNREEQLWVLVQAGSTAAPRHQDQAPCIEDWGISIMRVSSTGALWVSLGRLKPTLKSTSRSSPRQRMRVNSP